MDSSTNIEQHTPANSFARKVGNKCHTCNRTFSRLFDLQIHIKTVHLKLKRYKCTICNYACYFRMKLNSHVATIHGKQANSETVENLNVNEQASQPVAGNSVATDRYIKRFNFKNINLPEINKKRRIENSNQTEHVERSIVPYKVNRI